MSEFYKRLDDKEAERQMERIRNRPENLHDYQGCENDPAMQREVSELKDHQWTSVRAGGHPADAGSYEWVRYCKVCGMEDTCEDPLPPCRDESMDAAADYMNQLTERIVELCAALEAGKKEIAVLRENNERIMASDQRYKEINAELAAKVARLSAPISPVEFDRGYKGASFQTRTHWFESLIAGRLAPPQEKP